MDKYIGFMYTLGPINYGHPVIAHFSWVGVIREPSLTSDVHPNYGIQHASDDD